MKIPHLSENHDNPAKPANRTVVTLSHIPPASLR